MKKFIVTSLVIYGFYALNCDLSLPTIVELAFAVPLLIVFYCILVEGDRPFALAVLGITVGNDHSLAEKRGVVTVLGIIVAILLGLLFCQMSLKMLVIRITTGCLGLVGLCAMLPSEKKLSHTFDSAATNGKASINQEEARRKYEYLRQKEEARRIQEQERINADEARRKQQESAAAARANVKDQKYFGGILGLSGSVTFGDVKSRYRTLVAQYHPDKVNHLGPKLKEVAEEEMKKINEAYKFFEDRCR